MKIHAMPVLACTLMLAAAVCFPFAAFADEGDIVDQPASSGGECLPDGDSGSDPVIPTADDADCQDPGSSIVVEGQSTSEPLPEIPQVDQAVDETSQDVMENDAQAETGVGEAQEPAEANGEVLDTIGDDEEAVEGSENDQVPEQQEALDDSSFEAEEASEVAGSDDAEAQAAGEDGATVASVCEAVVPEAASQPTAVAAVPSAPEKASAKKPASAPQPSASVAPKAASKPMAKPAKADPAPKASIAYRAHVQKKGWMSWVGNGTLAGTSGKSLRMEAFQIKLLGASGGVQCQAHVQNVGWQNVVGQGGTVGTQGKSLRIEALRIMLTGDASRYYDVRYRAHVQNVGWQNWVKNGAIAGTQGRSLRIEAIEIELVKKPSPAARPTDGIVGVRYKGHVQNKGWQGYAENGAVAGTSGQSLRVEALCAMLDKGIYTGGVKYRAHVQNKGWQGWREDGAVAGTTGKSLRVEALQMMLTGNMAQKFDIVYRAHVQNVGWQPWAVNGAVAGTTGKSYRVEALQVKLVKKGTSQAVSEGTYIIAAAADPSFVADDPASSVKAGTQFQVASFSNDFDQRYYVTKDESGTYRMQSVASALFLGDKGGKLVQMESADDDSQRWRLKWDGGYRVENAATGKVLSIAGGKAAAKAKLATQADRADKVQRFTFTSTSLIPDGVYVFANTASEEVIDIYGARRTNGANVSSHAPNGGNNQKFKVTHLGSDVYSIRNVATGRAVEVAYESKSAGGNIQMYTWHAGPGQKWEAVLVGPSSFEFVNQKSGLVLARASAKDNANICQREGVEGASTQEFKLIPTKKIREVVNIGVPAILQNPELPTGCESVALTEALRYYGFKLGKTTIADKYMPWSGTDFVYSFMGNPHTSSGFMICAPGIKNAANRYLRAKGSSLRATNRTGTSFENLLTYVDRGVPVVVWNTMYMGNRGGMQASAYGYNGYSNTHAVTISGYDPFKKKVLIADPLSGSVWRNQARFKYLYNQMGRQAVTIE